MLNNIRWASYATALSILLFVYYGFVLIIYYRIDLLNYFKKITGGLNSFSLSHNLHQEKIDLEFVEFNPADEEKNNVAPKLLLDIQSIIKSGASRNFMKEELLLALKLHLQQQEGLSVNISKETIINFIKAQCEKYCSIHLRGEEINVLWVK